MTNKGVALVLLAAGCAGALVAFASAQIETRWAVRVPGLSWTALRTEDRPALGTGLVPLVIALACAAVVIVGGLTGVGAAAALIGVAVLSRSPRHLFLLFLASWPVVGPFLHRESPGPLPDFAYDRAMVPLLIVLAATGFIRARAQPQPLSFWVSAFLIVQVGAFLFWSINESRADPEISTLSSSVLIPVGVYWLTKVHVSRPTQLRPLLISVVVGIFLVCLTGIYERVINATASPFPVSTGTASGLRYLDVPGGRAAGIVGNPAIYGALMSIGVVLIIWLWPNVRPRAQRLLLAGAGSLMTYGIVVSYTRSAWASVVVGLLLAAVMCRLFLRALSAAVVVGLAVVVAVAVFLPGAIAGADLASGRLLESENARGRTARAAFSWEVFTERPVVGAGPGSLDLRIAEEFALEGTGFDSSHNTFLTLLVDGGIVLAVSYVGIVGSWVFAAIRLMRSGPHGALERHLPAALVAILAIYLTSGLFLELKWFGYFNALAWMAGALLETRSRARSKSRAEFSRSVDSVR